MIATILKILGAVASAFGILKQFGVDTGPVGSEVLNILTEIPVDMTNFQDGQMVILGTFSEQGIPGTIGVWRDGGVVAKNLGLA